MILQALTKYYEILENDLNSDIARQGYCKNQVAYAVILKNSGELIDVVSLKKEISQGKSKKIVQREEIVPEKEKKTSGIKSNFTCENLEYALGIYIDNPKETEEKNNKNRKKALEKNKAFVELHNKVLEDVETMEVKSFLKFINEWNPDEYSKYDFLSEEIVNDIGKSDIVFKFEGGKYLHQYQEVKQAWMKYYNRNESSGQEKLPCLITGELSEYEQTHPKFTGFRGAQSAGAMLVSFNGPAYESYGNRSDQGRNSPVSKSAAFKYGTALKTLLDDRKHSVYIGDSTVVYWAEESNKKYQDVVSLFFDTDELEEPQDNTNSDSVEYVKSVFEKISKGEQIVDIDKDFENPKFYILGLAPNAARLSVRFFLQDDFDVFVKNISKHYQDLSIERSFKNQKKYIPLWKILLQTVSPKSNDKASSPLLSGAVMRSILKGTAYPEALYNQIMLRVKSEAGDDINYEKAAIIKAILIRKNYNSEVLKMSINKETNNVSYLLGRLFAVLEKVQQDANGSTTIKQRYFSSASATPASVFPVLLRLTQHHINKAEYGKFSEDLIMEILEKVDIESNPIPKNLNLEEQGVFVLGYYHQRNDNFRKKETKGE